VSEPALNPAYRRRWTDARPWQTNLAFFIIGLGLIGYTRQLISENDHFTIGFSGVSSCSLILYLGAVLIFLIKPANTDRFTLPIILTIAIACRVVCLFEDPFLSSDVYRYAWDGVVQHAHINPYRYVASDPALAFLRDPNIDLYSNMNRRDYAHTIYPPVAQITFYLITFLSPTVTFMKVAMVLFEGLSAYGMTLLLRQLGQPREWVLLYAWCPLCIWEFGGSGHVDAMVIAFIVLAFLFRYRRQRAVTGLFLGLAVLSKFYPLVLIPALYQRRSDGKLDWKMPAVMAALAVASYSLYLSAGKLVFGFLGGYVQEEGLETGTRYFLLEFAQHLPGLHNLGNTAFLAFSALIFIALIVWCWRTCCRPDSPPASFLKPAVFLALAMMLLFSPHYPWYVAWLIPFLVLTPSLTVLTYVCGLFYLCTTRWATGTGAPQYHLNCMLYSAVAIAAAIEIALYRIPVSRHWMRQLAPDRFERA
jgi:alpha-1,6-mannosyltransferase